MKRAAALLLFLSASCLFAGSYRNFQVALYVRAYEVRQMKDLSWLEPRWNAVAKSIRFDKVYLETHRDLIVVDDETIRTARGFFESRGVKVAGGIATVMDERNRFQTFCYVDPAERRKFQDIIEHTARLFDEVILDDFFFTTCKCDACIQAKGNKTWTQFRLGLMADVAENLVIKPARAVNPKIKLTIKFPNWYEHFQYNGYDLEVEPKLFDKIYTGTETRDPVYNNQHLQPYEGYEIFRYFENIAPGRNGGGWVDPSNRGTLDRYAEQLWLTLFARAPEITLFDFSELLQPIRQPDGAMAAASQLAAVAGYTFDQVDGFIGEMGQPVGVAGYKPFHSHGEDFLHNYMGMAGVPINLMPRFPAEANMVLLTESAKFDPAIVDKIRKQLVDGKDVLITSGLLRALEGKGVEEFAELEYTDRKAAVSEFLLRFIGLSRPASEILIPEIRYPTNDAWEVISGLSKGVGYPVLLTTTYSRGRFYVLTIPEDFGDLYNYPPDVLSQIRRVLSKDLPVRLEGPGQVALFVYDTGKFTVESFLPHAAVVQVVTAKPVAKLRDLLREQDVAGQTNGNQSTFDIMLQPHSYRAFAPIQ